MIIRCEKCSTVYELEDRLIPPGGAPVQCSRCEHVFRAMPPGRAATPAPLALAPPPPDDLEPSGGFGPADPDDLHGAPPVIAPPDPAFTDAIASPEDLDDARLDELTRPDQPLHRPLDGHGPGSGPVGEPAPPRAEEPTPTPRPKAVLGPSARRTVTPVPVPPPDAPVEPPPERAAENGSAPTRTPVAGGSTYKPPAGPVIPPGKPVRKVPNPELEGSDVPAFTMPRRAIDFGEVSSRRKRSSGGKVVWAAVGLLGFLAVAGGINWWRESRSTPPPVAAQPAVTEPKPDAGAARAERQEALKLLARDDAASLERAAGVLDGAVRQQNAPLARADRALALALLAQQARDQAERLDGRARALEEERGKLGATEAPEAAARASALAGEAEGARAEVTTLRERADRLVAEARGELEAVPAELRADTAAVRAQAWVRLVGGEREEAVKVAAAGAESGEGWLRLANILSEVPESAGGEVLQRAAERLEKLGTDQPDLLRALFLAGRIRAGLGMSEQAVADLDAVLRVNPDHVDARRLRAEVGTAAAPEDGADEGPPVENVVTQPRKRGSTPPAP